jgi:ribosome biogenesis protein BMS1
VGRNDKANKRREAMAKKKAEKAKQTAVDDAARLVHNREERKKRYRDQGQAEKRAEAFRKTPTNKRGRTS